MAKKIKMQATGKLPSLFQKTGGNTIVFSGKGLPGDRYEYSVETATAGQTTITKAYIINTIVKDNIPQTTEITGRNTNTVTFTTPLTGGEEIFTST